LAVALAVAVAVAVAVAAVKRNLRQKKLPRKKAAARKGGQEKEIVLERI
jgi:hypothetical protein